MALQPILDPCCGAKMMWFDKQNQRALFGDVRSESHTLCDGRALEIKPDLVMDFTALPFDDETFRLVVFDPPHLIYAGEKSWLRKKYGSLNAQWRESLKKGFVECFRVLKPEGILIFKWNESQIKIKEVLALTDQKPLFGHPSGRKGLTHWYTFMKDTP
uniref:Methyltransferase domain n=1 Tax=Siphoviridae sp. ctMBu2 TaxID=2827853 RepID=A0A8S5T4D0_9CAUD|nr:MAG TPA: Methyltransferase domain [Siphoviridae sp. ctMBu2]